MRKRVLVGVLLGWLVALLPFAVLAAPNFNDPSFKTTWERVDKSVQDLPGPDRGFTWGPPAPGSAEVVSEPYNGGTRKVQYFDKARMEINNPAGDPNDLFYVTTGLLVKELVTGNRQDGDNTFTFVGSSQVQIAGDSNENGANAIAPTYASFKGVGTFSGTENSQAKTEGTAITNRIDKAGQVTPFTPPEQRQLEGYDTVTQHNVADVFTDYGNLQGLIWNGQSYVKGAVFFGNSLYVLGRPITEPYWVRAVVAGTERDVLVQLFERRVLTYTPSNPDGFKVEMGNVGQHYYRWRYEQNPTVQLSSGSQNYPAITAGNYAFWVESATDSSALYGYDLTKKTKFKIAETTGDLFYPASDGKTVVWVQTPQKSTIFQESIQGYDLATKKPFEIIKGSGTTGYFYLSVDGGKVYYQKSYYSKPGIYSRDLNTGQESFFTENGGYPVASNGILAWQTTRNLCSGALCPYEISLHMLKTDGSLPDTVIAKTDPDATPYPILNKLAISGNKIAWLFFPPSDSKFYVYDIAKGQVQAITPALPVRDMALSGNETALAFAPIEGTPKWSVGIYDLPTASTATVVRSSQQLRVWGITDSKGVLYSGALDDGTAGLYFTSFINE